jgi:hypothetical protein
MQQHKMSALLYINNLQRSIYTVVGMAPVDSWIPGFGYPDPSRFCKLKVLNFQRVQMGSVFF